MPEVEPLTKEENHLNMDISDLPLRGKGEETERS